MISLKRWRPELIGLILAAAITRLWDLFSPHAVVFDEVYFKAFAGHYLDGHYFFDIHPPLGKLLLAGWAHLVGIPASTLTSATDPTVALRVLPAVAGLLIVPVFWGILRRLGASRPFAFLGALALLCDNALLVESRFILIDSMLILFGLSTLYFYLVARETKGRRYWLWLSLAALCGGAAASTKWTGLTALALVGLIWITDLREHHPGIRRGLSQLAVLALIPVIVYTSAFWVHFKLLPNTGDGDAFMSPQFQQTLVGSPSYNPNTHLSFIQKFTQLNVEMFKANQTLTATHPYGSRWYTWPLEQRPIYYWAGDVTASGAQGNIYLLGNPIVWWGVALAAIIGLGYSWIARRKLRPATVVALALTGTAYLINLLPFTAVTRVMFLYHYFFAFIFSIAFVILLWNDLAAKPHGKPDHVLASVWSKRTFGAVVALIILGFLFFAPISYGTLLSPGGLQDRMWLHSWR